MMEMARYILKKVIKEKVFRQALVDRFYFPAFGFQNEKIEEKKT